MGDTEVRRVMRVVYQAVELVRENYQRREQERQHAPLRRKPGATDKALEKAGQTLWGLQSLLVSETPERFIKRFRDAAEDLRRQAQPLRRAGLREVAEALTDAADANEALAEISQLSLEAGLAG